MSKLIQGVNDLKTLDPVLASEWDYEKNDGLTPDMVMPGSGKRAWWKCSLGHSWQVVINTRAVRGYGCPYCEGRKAWPGFNDLATTMPEVAAEWDFERNGDLKPDDVLSGSDKRVWWICKRGHHWKTAVYQRKEGHGCPECANLTMLVRKGVNDLASVRPDLAQEWDHDKNTFEPDELSYASGQVVWWKCSLGHTWQRSINARMFRGQGCPYCAGQKVWQGFNDLATTMPEVAAEWDYDRNDDLTPKDVTAGRDLKVWWRCSKGHSWNAYVYARKAGSGCPVCAGNILIPGVNDLAGVRPDLLAEWDYEQNSDKSPEQVAAGSSKVAWWKCSRGHSWKAAISSRVRGNGCPVCAGKKVVIGVNDLVTVNPSLADEWDIQKNEFSPVQITSGSSRRVWWRCSKGHSWKASVAARDRSKTGCPYCAGKEILPGFNDLKTLYPEVIQERWDYDRNKDIMPSQIASNSGLKVWWHCEKGHVWDSRPGDVIRNGCPVCSNRRAMAGCNDLLSIHPDIAEEWDYEANEGLRPEDVTYMTGRVCNWKCRKGHSYKLSVYSRHKGVGCPYCGGRKALGGFNDLATVSPELVKEWDFERNQDISPKEILPFSNRKIWWKCSNGHHYRSNLNARNKGHGCPYCYGLLPSRTRLVP
ncbi:zinc-ribbon domain-containing protein [Butyrivibrio sp. INlla16]|uniref:zinc-ribbon domain-containing protein n=1 Tax=Butyrivibrio sp. INlla16 TaxID=1520807 RepID=UPI000888F8B7|nr:zinc-ribbon domain-containing protein [Butyrivibrio sp. INlla16]SDB12751.1 Probable Zinc-ribbon domain-containing protein [Butyrivibrio sp. INlla16]SDB49713.1 Probable Zinc-ribbon domain-containing protein [Butyrivibrio sp. INlla16]